MHRLRDRISGWSTPEWSPSSTHLHLCQRGIPSGRSRRQRVAFTSESTDFDLVLAPLDGSAPETLLSSTRNELDPHGRRRLLSTRMSRTAAVPWRSGCATTPATGSGRSSPMPTSPTGGQSRSDRSRSRPMVNGWPTRGSRRRGTQLDLAAGGRSRRAAERRPQISGRTHVVPGRNMGRVRLRAPGAGRTSARPGRFGS